MGWMTKGLAGVVGLASLGLGSWIVALLCFGYILFSLRPKKGSKETKGAALHHPMPVRPLLAGALAVLALAAVSSGGILSPFVLGGAALAVFFWPNLRIKLRFSKLTPTEDSILHRSSYNPFEWHAIAEVKPGSEEFAKSLSSFSGTLLIKAGIGKIFAPVRLRAFTRASAEAQVLSLFRAEAATVARGGSFLLPLEATTCSGLLTGGLKKTKESLADASKSADVLVLECEKGFVRSFGAYNHNGSREEGFSIPSSDQGLSTSPLVWEVLSSVGKRVKWAPPDAYSNMLHALASTRGEPLSERLESLEESGPNVTIRALGGDSLGLSRAQLRAVVGTYT